jgi:hypothetical protein
MKNQTHMTTSFKLTLGAVLWAALLLQPATLLAQGTAFTYQGRLDSSGNPATGSFDLHFALFDSASGGSLLAGPLTNAAVGVSNGLFTVTLDFGAGVFTGPARWLEIAVRTNGGGDFTTLASRQALTATPYAILAGNVSGVIPNSSLPANPSFSGSVSAGIFSGNGAGLTNLNASRLAAGTVAEARLPASVPLTHQANVFTGLTTFQPAAGPPFAVNSSVLVTNLNADKLDGWNAGAFWQLGGNAGTTPGTHFLGTPDNQPLELQVNNQRALRLEPAGSNSVNVLAGYGGNWIKPGVVAATISGGGAGQYAGAAYTNRIEADAATIGGGGGNTIAGGSLYAVVGGGVLNAIQGNAQFAAITGGSVNTIGSGATGATIGGGVGNLIGTNAPYATIPGGASCTATGAYAFAAGRRAKALHPGAFVWADGQDADLVSLTNNHVRFRCQHGVRFSSGSEAANQTVFWTPGNPGWTFTSDRDLKENFQPVDRAAVLERLARLPLSEWNYIGHPQRHLGPTAQDFHAAFPFTEHDTAINTGDLHGVTLAAIQGLYQKLEETRSELKRRDAENAALKARLEKLERWVERQLAGGAR